MSATQLAARIDIDPRRASLHAIASTYRRYVSLRAATQHMLRLSLSRENFGPQGDIKRKNKGNFVFLRK